MILNAIETPLSILQIIFGTLVAINNIQKIGNGLCYV